MKGYLTINTDASFHPVHMVGGYAFYIVCDKFKITKRGQFVNHPTNSQAAETMCILNALHVALNQKSYPSDIKVVTINSDCKYAMNDLKKETGRWGILYKRYRKAAQILFGNNIEIRFKHVKAHNGTSDARSWVNDWCDQNAKIEMRNAVALLKK